MSKAYSNLMTVNIFPPMGKEYLAALASLQRVNPEAGLMFTGSALSAAIPCLEQTDRVVLIALPSLLALSEFETAVAESIICSIAGEPPLFDTIRIFFSVIPDGTADVIYQSTLSRGGGSLSNRLPIRNREELYRIQDAKRPDHRPWPEPLTEIIGMLDKVDMRSL